MENIKIISETSLQTECFKWANNNYCLKHHNPRLSIFSVPNGGTRNKLEAMTLKATGLRSGVSDLIALYPNGLTVFFELKVGKGVQSDEQIDFEEVVKNLGFNYHLIYNFEDFKRIFESYLN